MIQIDLNNFVLNGVKEVFDKMLSMPIQPTKLDEGETISGKRIVGSVSFAGAIMGSVNIHVPEPLSKVLAASMLGMEPEEIQGEEEVEDVIGEMSNMIGGYLKSRFCDAGYPCELSIPSITKGTDFKIESVKWDEHKKFGFLQDNGKLIVEVFMKIPSK